MLQILESCKKNIYGYLPYLIFSLILVITVKAARNDGLSMYPTMNTNEISIYLPYKKVLQFDIVCAQFGDLNVIKRVIGLPGDTIEIIAGEVYINDIKIVEDYIIPMSEKETFWKYTIPDGMYFLMGDNRPDSMDSRYLGPISADDIKGVVIISF